MRNRSPYLDAGTAAKDLGRVVLIQPLPLRVAGFAAVTAAGVAAAFLVFGHYTPRTPVTGQLVPAGEPVVVRAVEHGRVTQQIVQLGQSVKAGDPLLVLSPPLRSNLLRESAAAPAAPEDALAEAQDGLKQARSESRKAEERVAADARRLDDARHALLRARRGGTINEAVHRQLDEVFSRRSQLQASEKARARADQALKQAQGTLAALQKDAPAERPGRSTVPNDPLPTTMLVRAPVAGIVHTINAEPGMLVSNHPLVTLMPADAPLEARLYVSAAQIAAIQPGQAVQMRYRALPGAASLLNEGVVTDVSRTPLIEPPRGAAATAMPVNGMHVVRVRLAKQEVATRESTQPLAAGLQVDAEIVHGAQRLLDWAFEPRHSMKGSTS